MVNNTFQCYWTTFKFSVVVAVFVGGGVVVCVCVCVCARARARAHVCVCVCVCVREFIKKMLNLRLKNIIRLFAPCPTWYAALENDPDTMEL